MGFSPARALRTLFDDIRSAPEAQYKISTAAPTQYPSPEPLNAPEKVYYHYNVDSNQSLSDKSSLDSNEKNVPLQAREAPVPRTTQKTLNALDLIVRATASRWTLGIVLLLLLLWGILGAVLGPTDKWHVVLQDVSSIQAYISAILLMRQQNTNTRSLLGRICGLISRSESNERMVGFLTTEQRVRLRASTRGARDGVVESLHRKEDLFDKAANGVARAIGSLISLGIYTAGIIVWLGTGFPAHFSDTWQLYVNTATALEITFVTVFLQNIRGQHDHHLAQTVKGIEKLDMEIEMRLRGMTGDLTPNPVIASQPRELTKWEKGIDMFAFVHGGFIGVVISVIIFAIWVPLGLPMRFDDNWFLIIGTYTGLIGFIDGFVLKNVDARQTKLANSYFEKLVSQDTKISSLIGVEVPASILPSKTSLNMRISKTMGRWVESTIASYVSVGVVFGVVIIASAMQWSVTGQLICNTPTMIVEGFLLITLLQAHNMADHRRRLTYEDILNRRLVLEKHIAAWGDLSGSNSITNGEEDEVVINNDIDG